MASESRSVNFAGPSVVPAHPMGSPLPVACPPVDPWTPSRLTLSRSRVAQERTTRLGSLPPVPQWSPAAARLAPTGPPVPLARPGPLRGRRDHCGGQASAAPTARGYDHESTDCGCGPPLHIDSQCLRGVYHAVCAEVRPRRPGGAGVISGCRPGRPAYG